MLSGEGNDGERWKTAIGLISKKNNFARAAHFFVHFFAVVLHDYNAKLPENFFYGGNVVRVLVHFFFFSLPLIFSLHWWPLAFLILSPPLQNFHPRRCSSNKQWLLCFLSVALDLCRPFSRWVSLACRLLSMFLCLSLALYSKFVDMTINSERSDFIILSLAKRACSLLTARGLSQPPNSRRNK